MFTEAQTKTARFSTHSLPACEIHASSSFVRFLLFFIDYEIYQITLSGCFVSVVFGFNSSYVYQQTFYLSISGISDVIGT